MINNYQLKSAGAKGHTEPQPPFLTQLAETWPTLSAKAQARIKAAVLDIVAAGEDNLPPEPVWHGANPQEFPEQASSLGAFSLVPPSTRPACPGMAPAGTTGHPARRMARTTPGAPQPQGRACSPPAIPSTSKAPPMQLLPPVLAATLPPIYAQESKGMEAVVHVKFFLESFTWYATEYDPAERVFFGFVVSSLCPDGELGYFSLDELESVRGRFGGVERDLYFEPKTLAEVLEP